MWNPTAVFTRAAVAAIALVGCGGNGSASTDAHTGDAKPVDSHTQDTGSGGGFDFSCAGNSAPTTVGSVTVSGTVDELGVNGTTPQVAPLNGASLTLCTGDCANANNLGSATSNSSGAFSFSAVSTGGTAIDGYVKMTHSGDGTVLAYPPSPFATNTAQQILTFETILLDAVGPSEGCDQDSANGIVGLLVTDCAGTLISDATVTVKQNGTTVGDTPVNASSVSTMAAGFYLICNVPPGVTTTVGATVGSTTLRPRDVQITADTTSETTVRPGF